MYREANFLINYRYLDEVVDTFHTFDQLQTSPTERLLRPLIISSSNGCHHSITIALLVLKWHYAKWESDEHRLNETKGYACEIVAARILAHLSQSDLIDSLLYELPSVDSHQSQEIHGVYPDNHQAHVRERSPYRDEVVEYSSLIHNSSDRSCRWRRSTNDVEDPLHDIHNNGGSSRAANEKHLSIPFVGLNALEIATIAGVKKFLSQKVVQNIVDGVWSGDIVFWHSLNVHSEKKAQPYNPGYVSDRNSKYHFELPVQYTRNRIAFPI